MKKIFLLIIIAFSLVHLAYANDTETYKLTEQSFKRLQENGVASSIINELKSLQDQLFQDKKEFITALHEKIGNEQTKKYRKLLLNNARNFLLVFAPPSIWAQEKKGTKTELEGPIIDFAATIFSESRIPIRSRNFPWARALRFMESGEVDLILTIFYTEKRAKIMDFSIPYVEIPSSVFVPKGKSFPFKKLDDLIGKNGLIIINASHGLAFEKIKPRLSLTPVPGEEQIIRMLDKGRADYAVGPKYVFQIKAQKLKLRDKIEVLPNPITSRSLHIGFSKKSPFLQHLPTVNQKIKQLQEDGTIAKMVEKAIAKAAKK